MLTFLVVLYSWALVWVLLVCLQHNPDKDDPLHLVFFVLVVPPLHSYRFVVEETWSLVGFPTF